MSGKSPESGSGGPERQDARPYIGRIDNAERVLERLAQDARLGTEARMLPDGPLTEEQVQGVRDAALLYLDRNPRLTANKIARGIDRAASTVQAFLAGKYDGDNEDVARRVAGFMEQHTRGESSGMPQGYVSTRVAELCLAVMRDAREKRVMNLIYGPAGVGKSFCCKAAMQYVIPGSVHVECTEGATSPGSFSKLWARRLGLPATGTIGDVEDRIIDMLSRSEGRLQLIDEAHKLSRGAMNIIRDVHKQAGVGIVLIGTIDVTRHVDDESEFYGQFSSLFNHRYHITEEQASGGTPLYSTEEVGRFVKSMQLRLTPRGIEDATWLACLPGLGGLRFLTRLMLKAKLLAGDAAIAPTHIMAAIAQSYGPQYADRLQSRREQFARKVKVA